MPRMSRVGSGRVADDENPNLRRRNLSAKWRSIQRRKAGNRGEDGRGGASQEAIARKTRSECKEDNDWSGTNFQNCEIEISLKGKRTH